MARYIKLSLAATIVALLISVTAAADEDFAITRDVVYGHKAGMALTYDVIQHKEKDNDAALLFMMSGGWFSGWVAPEAFVREDARQPHFRELVEEGYTLYIVRHGSAPYFKVPDAVADVRKAVRHIRHNAGAFTIDPNRIGVFGGSAGGHLSLMLGTASDEGNPEAKSEVEKESDRVAAVVAYFPPVNLNESVGPSDRFPALDFDPAKADSVSPLLHVTSDDAPTLLVHGDEDQLVRLDNSQRIFSAFQDKNVTSRLVIIEGAAHGFRGEDAQRAAFELKAWFHQHLSNKEQATAAAPNRRRVNYPPQMDGATVQVYKQTTDGELNIYIFKPENHKLTDTRPVVVFFFGGGWRSGTPAQFEQHCRYLASRGMVAMTADYRVLSRHQTKAHACVEDGKSAVRWIRENAERLGIDPNRIVSGGGSAGGHVAACTATVPGFEVGNTSVSSRPNALTLFNPALVLAPVEGNSEILPDRLAQLRERMGVPPAELSPYHQVRSGTPPTIIFHGTADTTVSFSTAAIFTAKVKSNGDPIRLLGYADQGHGFFNYGRDENKMFAATMKQLDDFLVELGYLEGEATIDAWVSDLTSG